MKRRPLFFLLLLLAPLLGAETQISFSSSQHTVLIGEQVQLRLIAKTSEEADRIKLTLPEKADFDILQRQAAPLRRENNETILEETLTVAFFRTGEFTVPAMPVTLYRGAVERGRLETPALTIRVKSSLTEKDTDIKPLKPPLELHGNPYFVLAILLAFLLVVLIATAVTMLVISRRRRRAAPPAAVLPAEEEFARAIRQLAAADWRDAAGVKGLAITLTDAVKHFLVRQYNFPAPDFTTWETLRELPRRENDRIIHESMRVALETTDLIKFAARLPEQGEVQRMFAALHEAVSVYRLRVTTMSSTDHAAPGQ